MAIFDISYVGEMPYLKLTGGTVTGATTFNDNLAVSTINGVVVGSNPQFTDTTYSVATTSANGLLPALGGGTTNYLRADGSWAKPVGTTYSVATTSANGLMAAADKVAVNKIGTGTLNTTNQTIIPAINELVAKGVTPVPFEASVTIPAYTDTSQTLYTFNKPCIVFVRVTNGTVITANTGSRPFQSHLSLSYEEWNLISVTRAYSSRNNTTNVYSGGFADTSDLVRISVNSSSGAINSYRIGAYSFNSTSGATAANIQAGTICIFYSKDLSSTSSSINAYLYNSAADTLALSGFYIPLA